MLESYSIDGQFIIYVFLTFSNVIYHDLTYFSHCFHSPFIWNRHGASEYYTE